MALFQFLQPGAPARPTGALRWTEGEWSATNLAANATVQPLRATGQSQAASIPRAGKICGFTCMMSNLGAVDAVAGGAITVQAIRQPKTGAPDGPVTIGTIIIGESNISKPVTGLGQVAFAAGELVYVQLVTPVGFTSVTVDPKLTIELEAT